MSAADTNDRRPVSSMSEVIASARVATAPFAKRTPSQRKAEAGRVTKPKKVKGGEKPGPDGTVYQARRITTGTQAIATHKVRCRPGTFEWRYGRFGNPQYHAGADFAHLWERAGVASASGIKFEASGGGGGFGGLPDARTLAMDRIRGITQEIGGPMARRLVSYCVEGRTPKEIAASYRPQLQVSDRQISDTLDLDLHELAKAMNYA